LWRPSLTPSVCAVSATPAGAAAVLFVILQAYACRAARWPCLAAVTSTATATTFVTPWRSFTPALLLLALTWWGSGPHRATSTQSPR
jgi:hypothetical protein